MAFSVDRIQNMTVQEYNAAREEIYSQLWSETNTYDQYRDMYVTTGNEIYLERMLERVEDYFAIGCRRTPESVECP